MPFQSEKQRRYLHANHPEIAKRWERDYATGGISNHFRKKYSLGEGPVMEDTESTDFISSLTQEQVDDDPERYAQLLIGLRKPDFFMGEGDNQRAYFIQSDNSRISVPWGFRGYGLSYEPTIDFKKGGIANHFKLKNGGSYAMQGGVKNYLGDQQTVSGVPIKWQSGPDNPDTELAYITKAEKDLILKKDLHGSLKDGPNTGPEGLMSLDSQGDKGTYGQTGQSYGDRQTTDTSPEVGDAPSKQDLQEYKENRAIREANQKAADDAKKASKDLSFEDKWGKYNDKYDKLNKYSFTAAGVKKRAKLTDQNYNEDRAVLEKKFGKSLITKIAMAFLGMPISIGFKDIKAVKSMYDLQKTYKADMQNLKDISIDKGWADFHHAVDTPMQTIDQLMMDTIKVRDEDDTRGDGGVDPIPLPVVMDEMADATGQIDMFDAWGDIKQKQALRASLFADEDQAKVGDWVGDQRLLVNSGGLANLFRVKNNQ